MAITLHQKPSQMTWEELKNEKRKSDEIIADIEGTILALTYQRGIEAIKNQHFVNEIHRREHPNE